MLSVAMKSLSQSAIEESLGFVAGGKSPQHVADWRHGHFS
jgi:hypothetical protein